MNWSIIIPTYEKENFTKSCLEDLSKLNSSNHEIIIVDNSITNKTKDLVDNLNIVNVRYLKSDKNTFSHACNLGYHNSCGENVLFLNNDIKVEQYTEWTDLLLDKVKNDLIIAGPTGGCLDSKTFEFKYETRGIEPINYISGWCLAASRNTLEYIKQNNNVFCEDFGFYFEDADLGWTATKMGVKLEIVNIPVRHFGKVSTDKSRVSKLYLNGKNIFLKKWKVK